MIPIKVIKKYDEVGLPYIIDLLNVLTPFGNDKKNSIEFFKTIELLEKELNKIENIINSKKNNEATYNNIEKSFMMIKDIRGTILRCEENKTLDIVELYEVKLFLMNLSEIKKLYDSLNLKLNKIDFYDSKKLMKILNGDGKNLPTFHIYEEYSSNLKKIRKEKKEIENLIYKENNLDNLVKLKKERLNIVIKEDEEQLKIRKEITEEIKKEVEVFKENFKSIGELDLLLGKSSLAQKHNGIKPIIHSENYLLIENMVNIELKEKLKNKDYTKVSIMLKKGTTLLTGANMGGKSVTLKTVALNTLLSQLGFFVFADKFEVPLYKFVKYIHDDLEEMEKGISSFGGEIIELKKIIIQSKKSKGLIILDEFARGTNPTEGEIILKSIGLFLNNQSSNTLMSTHLNIKEKTIRNLEVVGLKNINVRKIEEKIKLERANPVHTIQKYMDYNIKEVDNKKNTPKEALNICMLLGLDKDIIDIAKTYYKNHKED